MNEFDAPRAPTPEYLEREATRLRVYTPSVILEGDYAHPPGVRLSDSLRNAASNERYILITNVTMRTVDGGPMEAGVASAPFVLVNTSHTSVLIPLEEHERQRNRSILGGDSMAAASTESLAGTNGDDEPAVRGAFDKFLS